MLPNTSVHTWFLLSSSCVIALLPSGSAFSAEEGVTDRISQALHGDWGQVTLNLRYRYERVAVFKPSSTTRS